MVSQTVPVHARKTNPCKTFETADDDLWRDDVPVLATHVNIVQHDGGDSSDGTADVKGVHLVASLLSTSFSAGQGWRRSLRLPAFPELVGAVFWNILKPRAAAFCLTRACGLFI